MWKITKAEGQSAGIPKRLPRGVVLKLRNGQAMDYLACFAYDSDRNLEWVSLGG